MLAIILGWISTVIFSICILPQLWKTWKSKKADDISIFSWILFFVGNITALIYGILINQWPLIIKYVFALVSSFLLTALCLWYNRSSRSPMAETADLKPAK